MVGLRPPSFVGLAEAGFSICDRRLHPARPVRAGILKSLQRQRPFSRETMGPELVGLERSVHLPAGVVWVEVMRGDALVGSGRLGGLEYPLHVLDRPVFGDAGSDRSPVCSLRAQHVVLRIDEHDGGVGLPDVHVTLLIVDRLRDAGRRGRYFGNARPFHGPRGENCMLLRFWSVLPKPPGATDYIHPKRQFRTVKSLAISRPSVREAWRLRRRPGRFGCCRTRAPSIRRRGPP